MPYSQRGVTPGMRGSLPSGRCEDAIADEHGPAVFQPPYGALPGQRAIAVTSAGRIDVFVTMGVVEFEFGGSASRRLFLPPSLPPVPPFGFPFEAVVRGPHFRPQRRGTFLGVSQVRTEPIAR